MPRRLALALAGILLVACGGGSAPRPFPAASATPATPSPPPAATPSPSPTPAGMTLEQEVGAVIMAGFQGPLTPAVLADWRQRQFGGLLVVNLNHNAQDAAQMRALVAGVRAASPHRLVAATDQEGGYVCIAVATVPCDPMPVGQAATTQMAAALKQLGFDLDLGPVSDVCSGSASIMWGRCYGTDPAAVASAVGPVVDGIHAAGLLAAAKHFPGHGDTSVSSETTLPRIDESIATLEAREFPPFEAAAAHGVDFVLMGHLYYPAIDPGHSADLAPETYPLLRQVVGFQGAVISDDMEMGAITASTPVTLAAVQFLQEGGDMVMIAHHLEVADQVYDAILAAVRDGTLPRSRLDDAVAHLEALRPTGD